jgi:hypothetical protein
VSDEKHSTSDEIRIIHAQAGVNDTVLLVQAITRGVVAVTLVVAGAYLLVNQIPISENAFRIAALVLGSYFGIEGAAAYLKRTNGNARR